MAALYLLLLLLPTAFASRRMVPIAPGVDMPEVSLGHPDDKTGMAESLELWLNLGGRGIDTAWIYYNQKQVAEGLAKSGVPREEVFITTKIPCYPSADKALQMVKRDLDQLNTTYVDLMLIHFPCKTEEGNVASWRGLQEAYKQNLTRSIGVSNFKINDIKAIMALNDTIVPKPAVNQCSMSVGNHDDETITFCKQNNITYEAYSPLRDVNLTDSTLGAIANSHSVEPAQVALKWILQKNCVLATSPGGNEKFAKEDLVLDSFTLTDEEMNTLDNL